MGRALWIPDQLQAAGLRTIRVPGWDARGWTSVAFRGLVCHHTASGRGRNAPSLSTVTYGRPGLPGPLCQVLLARDGTCYVVAAGGANHAGRGGWDGLVGNSTVMGIEAENDGVDEPWPAVQIDAYHRCARALNAGMAAAARRTCGHKEWAPTRKIDPTGIDMAAFRRTIDQEDAFMAVDQKTFELHMLAAKLDRDAQTRALAGHTTKLAKSVIAQCRTNPDVDDETATERALAEVGDFEAEVTRQRQELDKGMAQLATS